LKREHKTNGELKGSAGETELRADFEFDAGHFREAADLYFSLESIHAKMGDKVAAHDFRRKAGDAYALAKDWGMAAVVYRGLLFQSSREGEFEDELLLQYWKLKAAERNFLRQTRRWGRWILYSLWHLVSDYGTGYAKVISWMAAVIFFFGLLYACGNWWTAGHFIETQGGMNFLDYLYFSGANFTTLGVGDMWPAHSVAKLIVLSEAFMGILFAGLFLSVFARRVMMFHPLDLGEKERISIAKGLMRYRGTESYKPPSTLEEVNQEDCHCG
jgi:hypothetical protein